MSMISRFIIDIDRESLHLVNMRFESLQSLSSILITVDMSSHKYSHFPRYCWWFKSPIFDPKLDLSVP